MRAFFTSKGNVMPITQIPLYTGETPQRTQSPEVFSNNADAWLEYQAPLAANYNQLASEVNSIAENTQGIDDSVAQSVAQNQAIQQDIDSKAQQVSDNTTEVANNTQTVTTNTQTVTDKAQQVSADADQVALDRLAVANNAQTVADNTQAVADNATQVSEDKGAVTQMLADTEAAAQEAASTIPQTVNASLSDLSGGMVVNRLDANGNQNVMYKIPMFTNKIVNDVLGTNWLPEEDVHPAFKRADNTIMPWFEVGMYIASNDGNGNPVSAPHKQPYHTVDFDQSKAKCQSMGSGWGLMTNAQWSAIAIWCLMNEYQPTGSTYYGQSHDKKFQTSIRQDGLLVGDASGTAQNLTGTGPKEWNHNNSAIGIADLVGNVWEWVDGLKMQDGQIIVAENSDYDELNWISQAAYLDDGLKLNSELTDITNTNVAWSSLGKSETYIDNQLLQQLMIEPTAETGAALGLLYYNNDGERLPRRGGSWSNGSGAGLGALALSGGRSNRSSYSGFRPAYFE